MLPAFLTQLFQLLFVSLGSGVSQDRFDLSAATHDRQMQRSRVRSVPDR